MTTKCWRKCSFRIKIEEALESTEASTELLRAQSVEKSGRAPSTMVPPDSTEETTCAPSCGRPKRGAAVKAEGVFRALALTSKTPDGNSDSGKGSALRTSTVDSGTRVSAAAATSFEATASKFAEAVAVISPEASETLLKQSGRYMSSERNSFAREEPFGVRESEAAIGNRRATARQVLIASKQKKTKGGKPGEQKRARDRKAVSMMRRGVGPGATSGRSENRAKPDGKVTAAATAQVLQNLSGFGMVRVRTPANAETEDVWKGVEVVLQNLPKTSDLTVDELVGHARLRRFRPPEESVSSRGHACGGEGCGEVRVATVVVPSLPETWKTYRRPYLCTSCPRSGKRPSKQTP